MEYWINILTKYLSYSVVRYAVAAISAFVFIIIMSICNRHVKRRPKRQNRLY